MKYQAYEEYKDSGVEWLEDVPEHWVVSKFGYVKTVLTDFTANGSFADLKKNVIYRDEPSYARLVRLTDLRKNLENENGVWIDEDAYNYISKSALYGGEFLLANVGAYAGLFYQMPDNKGHASLAPNMFMAKFDDTKINREYMAYVGQSSSANEQLKLNATAASAQPKLNKDDFKSIRFTYPKACEQIKIASFLDHETAKIDTLIEKQQQLIKRLKENRQAVISHAVTKGLNPSTPMRDSGIEWLGEAPEHWAVSALKYHVDTVNGFGFSSSDVCEEGVPFIRAGNIKKKSITPTDLYLPQSVVDRYKRVILSEGDIVISMVGSDPRILESAVGQIGVVPKSMEGSVPNQNVVILREKSDSILKQFLFYTLCSDPYRNHLNVFSHKLANQSIISSSLIVNAKFMIPGTDEQKKIIDFLDQRLKKIDEVVMKNYSSLELLWERRTALISAAVTGKVDVRSWQAPNKSNKDAIA